MSSAGPVSVRHFQREGQPAGELQLERVGAQIRTLRLVGAETESDRLDHFTDRHVAMAQFDARTEALLAAGWARTPRRTPLPRRREAASLAFIVAALWAGPCFGFGVPDLGQTPEAAVRVFFAAPGATVPALLGSVEGSGPSRWCNAILALPIPGVLVWSVVNHPRLETAQVLALSVFAFSVTLFLAYCWLHLRRGRS